MWTQEDALQDPNPPILVAALSEIEKFEAKGRDKLSVEDLQRYVEALASAEIGFAGFVPKGEFGQKLEPAADVVGEYRDLAKARLEAMKLDLTKKLSAGLLPQTN
jgi:hypothetical protein